MNCNNIWQCPECSRWFDETESCDARTGYCVECAIRYTLSGAFPGLRKAADGVLDSTEYDRVQAGLPPYGAIDDMLDVDG